VVLRVGGGSNLTRSKNEKEGEKRREDGRHAGRRERSTAAERRKEHEQRDWVNGEMRV